MRNLYYSVKRLKLSAFIPVAVVCVIFPLLTYHDINNMTEEMYKMIELGEKAQMFIPIMAAWCPLMSFRQYVEGDTRELIFFYQKTHLAELLFYGVTFAAVSAVPFLILSQYVADSLAAEYLRVMIQSAFFITLAYGVTFLLNSATGGLLICLLVDFLLIFSKNYIPANKSIFSFGQKAAEEMFVLAKGESIDKYWILIIISVVFLIVGYISSHRAKT